MLRVSKAFVFGIVGCLASGCTPEPSDDLKGGDSCTELTDGVWTLSGPAWGMGDATMTGMVTMDAEKCSFTLDAYDMAMDDLPTGGVVNDTRVTLDGPNTDWRSCDGTASDPATVSGDCPDHGGTFSMVLTE